MNDLTDMVDELDLAAKHRAVTGVLASHPDSRDVQVSQLAITFHGAEILTDTTLELNVGRRYGLVGLNGCGELPEMVLFQCDFKEEQNSCV